MAKDKGSNTLRKAAPLELNSGSVQLKDRIGGRDRNDFYRINLSDRSYLEKVDDVHPRLESCFESVCLRLWRSKAL